MCYMPQGMQPKSCVKWKRTNDTKLQFHNNNNNKEKDLQSDLKYRDQN